MSYPRPSGLRINNRTRQSQPVPRLRDAYRAGHVESLERSSEPEPCTLSTTEKTARSLGRIREEQP